MQGGRGSLERSPVFNGVPFFYLLFRVVERFVYVVLFLLRYDDLFTPVSCSVSDRRLSWVNYNFTNINYLI